MENFTAISRHPTFSRSIKEIVYDAALNEASLLDIQRYKEEYRYRYSDADEETCQRDFIQYWKVFDDQQAILDTGEDFAVLKAGMDLLPNAKSILVLDGLHNRSFCDWYDNKGPGSWDASPTFYPRFSYSNPEAPWDLRIVQNILRAISLSDTRIESLVLGVGGWKNDKGAVSFTPTQLTGANSGHARSAVQSLTKLWIQFQADSFKNSSVRGPYVSSLDFQRVRLGETRSLVGWLSEAQNLTELTLKFCRGFDWDGSRELLETALWPSLRAVRLANIRCYKSPVAGFVRRHVLEVADFDITRREGVAEVYTELVAFTKVHLEQVLLKSVRDNCWWPSNIKLTYITRKEQRERIEAKGYVADASLSRSLVAKDVTCALHGAACVTERLPIVI